MKISSELSPFYDYGDEKKIVKLLKKSGFTAYDFSMIDYNTHTQAIIGCEDYIERAYSLRKYADEIGIKCNQTHAPFPSLVNGNYEYNKKIFPYLVKAIEVSGILGAKNCVVHPCNTFFAEKNAEFYETLKEYAVKNKVRICTENMFNWDKESNKATVAACATAKDFKELLSLLDKNIFGACLDLGHAELIENKASAVEMIHELGDRLVALHIQDNDKHYDLHNLPYTNKLNYEAILKALQDVGYKGDITFESGNFICRLPTELYPAGAKFIADMGKYFKKIICDKT